MKTQNIQPLPRSYFFSTEWHARLVIGKSRFYYTNKQTLSGDKIERTLMVLLIYLIYFWFLLPNLIYVKVSWTRIHYVVKCNLNTFYWHTVIQSFLSISRIISPYIILHRSNHRRGNFQRSWRICGEGGKTMSVTFHSVRPKPHDNPHSDHRLASIAGTFPCRKSTVYANLTFLFLFNVTALNHLDLEIDDVVSLVWPGEHLCLWSRTGVHGTAFLPQRLV